MYFSFYFITPTLFLTKLHVCIEYNCLFMNTKYMQRSIRCMFAVYCVDVLKWVRAACWPARSLRADRCLSQAPVRESCISGHWGWRPYTHREKLMIWESTAATSVLRWASVTQSTSSLFCCRWLLSVPPLDTDEWPAAMCEILMFFYEREVHITASSGHKNPSLDRKTQTNWH